MYSEIDVRLVENYSSILVRNVNSLIMVVIDGTVGHQDEGIKDHKSQFGRIDDHPSDVPVEEIVFIARVVIDATRFVPGINVKGKWLLNHSTDLLKEY